jgi:hypothetical protein
MQGEKAGKTTTTTHAKKIKRRPSAPPSLNTGRHIHNKGEEGGRQTKVQ